MLNWYLSPKESSLRPGADFQGSSINHAWMLLAAWYLDLLKFSQFPFLSEFWQLRHDKPRGLCGVPVLVNLPVFWSLLNVQVWSREPPVSGDGPDWKGASTFLPLTCSALWLRCLDSQPRVCQEQLSHLSIGFGSQSSLTFKISHKDLSFWSKLNLPPCL